MQKNNVEKAKITLAECPDNYLLEILRTNSNLLFDSTLVFSKTSSNRKNREFSELTTLLISKRSELLSEVFFEVLKSPQKVVTLREVIKVSTYFINQGRF